MTTINTAIMGVLTQAREALEGAEHRCRFHGDVRPSGTGFLSRCDSCEQPYRVRTALAAIRNLLGRAQAVRLYIVDATARPHQSSGLFPVVGVSGLFAPAQPDAAREVVLAELAARGEPGLDNVTVQVRGPISGPGASMNVPETGVE